MTTPAPNSDASVALALVGAGYWVAPLVGYKKNPPTFGTRTHGDILKEKDKSYLDAVVLAQQHTATGWAAILQATDPIPLVVVDVDAYGVTLDAAWAMLTSEPMPQSLGVVRSATGGFHFYFRLPDAATAKRLPSTWDFGNGRKGEIRASRDALQLIVLPGSVARNKHGELGRYEPIGQSLADISALALMPDSLLMRLADRNGGESKPTREGLPTEAQHFLGLLHFISEIPPGEQNARIAQVGQVLGRIGPADKPPPDLVSLAWDGLRDRLPPAAGAAPWSFSNFERALASGYKTGVRSRVKHTGGAASGTPTTDDVKAEFVSMFGSVPWLIEITNSKGEFQEFILGYGGEPHQRAGATGICSIKDAKLPHLMAELSRLIPTCDQNALTRSPLFLDPAWSKVARHFLMHERSTERIGNDPEARFWEILNESARSAAHDLKFLDTLSGPWRALDCKAWLIQSATEPPILSLHPDAVERLYLRIGDMPLVKRLLALNTRARTLAGTGLKQTLVEVCHLTPETQAHVRRGYEQWVSQKQKESKDESAAD